MTVRASGPALAAGLAGVAVVGLVLGACGRAPADKIVGWPPREPIVAVRDVVEDAAADVEDAAEDVEDDAADVEVEAPVLPPCRRVVDLVCELEGRFTDACREARTHPPDDTHPETSDACAALEARFIEHELPRVGSACARYAREVCKTLGDTSEPCRTAQGQVVVRTSRRELRACLGDLLWSQTRLFRR